MNESSTSREVADEMLASIRRIVRRISEHSRHLSREAGLTVPQLMCLKAIGELELSEPEITVAMVAHRVQLSPATVSRIIDRMARAGLVERERRAKDRRKVCLSLTPAGLDRYQTLPQPLQEQFINRLMKLPTSERQGLLDALQRIVELMDAEDIDAAPMLVPGMDIPEPPSS